MFRNNPANRSDAIVKIKEKFGKNKAINTTIEAAK